MTFLADQRIPGPFSRWPNCLQKLSIGPLEIGYPRYSYVG